MLRELRNRFSRAASSVTPADAGSDAPARPVRPFSPKHSVPPSLPPRPQGDDLRDAPPLPPRPTASAVAAAIVEEKKHEEDMEAKGQHTASGGKVTTSGLVVAHRPKKRNPALHRARSQTALGRTTLPEPQKGRLPRKTPSKVSKKLKSHKALTMKSGTVKTPKKKGVKKSSVIKRSAPSPDGSAGAEMPSAVRSRSATVDVRSPVTVTPAAASSEATRSPGQTDTTPSLVAPPAVRARTLSDAIHASDTLRGHRMELGSAIAQSVSQRDKAGGLSGLETRRKDWALEELKVLAEEAGEWVGAMVEQDVLKTQGPDDHSYSFDRLFRHLSDGVVLCDLLTKVSKGELKLKPSRRALPGTFQARDNITQFLATVRSLGVPDTMMFDGEDLVQRRNAKSIILCLLNVARVLSDKYRVRPPLIVQMEIEIDTMDTDPAVLAKLRESRLTLKGGDELDRQVFQLIEANDFALSFSRILDRNGLYRIVEMDGAAAVNMATTTAASPGARRGSLRLGLGSVVNIRSVRGLLMVRVGGGWENLVTFCRRRLNMVTGNKVTKVAVNRAAFESTAKAKTSGATKTKHSKRKSSSSGNKSPSKSSESKQPMAVTDGGVSVQALNTPRISVPQSLAVVDIAQLPVDEAWTLVFHPDSHEPYFYNTVTEETSWSRPANATIHINVKESGRYWWYAFHPDTGQPYYYNVLTEDTTWSRPVDCPNSVQLP